MGLRKKLFGLFFLSGFCGLLYQVIWVRLAFAHFGVITPVLSIVVSVFMLGLASGSWAAGKIAVLLNSRFKISAAYGYGFCELMIGLGAFAVPWLFSRGDMLLLPGGEMNSVSYLGLSGLVLAASILPWCLCMGATYPLMMAFMKEREPSSTESFSFLYLANVIGAVAGTVLTADVLVEWLGFQQTLLLAGCTNLFIAAVSVSLALESTPPLSVSTPGKAKPDPPSLTLEKEAPIWLGLILLTTGLVSMSMEVVWTRAFTPILANTIYAFALILAVYLAATAVGSSLYRIHFREYRTFSTDFLLLCLAMSAFLPIVINDPRLHLLTSGVILSLIPPCAVLGYLTPKIIDQYSQGNPDRAGRGYAVNVAGCVIGPLFASYVLLPACGVKLSLVWLVLPLVLLWGAFARRTSIISRTVAAIFITAFFVISVEGTISYEEKYPGAIVRRDHTATVISVGTGMSKLLLVNGQGITELTTVTKTMAHLPLGVFPGNPHSALVICFGMGTTYRSLLSWGVRTTAVELVPSVKDAFGFYHADADRILRDPNGQIVIDDGRRFLRRTSELFDVVTIDPPPPIEAAGSSLLYSREFYQLLKTRLTPDGILQQWFPGENCPEAEAVGRSLAVSFPYVRVFRSLHGEGLHFLASMRPLKIPTANQLVARMPEAARRDYVEWEPKDVKILMQKTLAHEVPLSEVLGDNPRRMITDNRPFNEYYLLRRTWGRLQRRYHRWTSG